DVRRLIVVSYGCQRIGGARTRQPVEAWNADEAVGSMSASPGSGDRAASKEIPTVSRRKGEGIAFHAPRAAVRKYPLSRDRGADTASPQVPEDARGQSHQGEGPLGEPE